MKLALNIFKNKHGAAWLSTTLVVAVVAGAATYLQLQNVGNSRQQIRKEFAAKDLRSHAAQAAEVLQGLVTNKIILTEPVNPNDVNSARKVTLAAGKTAPSDGRWNLLPGDGVTAAKFCFATTTDSKMQENPTNIYRADNVANPAIACSLDSADSGTESRINTIITIGLVPVDSLFLLATAKSQVVVGGNLERIVEKSRLKMPLPPDAAVSLLMHPTPGVCNYDGLAYMSLNLQTGLWTPIGHSGGTLDSNPCQDGVFMWFPMILKKQDGSSVVVSPYSEWNWRCTAPVSSGLQMPGNWSSVTGVKNVNLNAAYKMGTGGAAWYTVTWPNLNVYCNAGNWGQMSIRMTFDLIY